jgi:hypothetical protein
MVPHLDTIVTFADLHRQNLLAWPRVSHRRVVRRHEVPSSPRNDSKDPKMSTTNRSRSLFIGSAVVFAFTLLAPVTVMAEEEVADLAPVAAPAAVGTSIDEVRATRALAAQNALQNGDIGSMQEDALFAIVAASTTAEQTRVLTAQQALQSPDLGSLQEEALTAIVEASSAEVER